MSAGDKSFIAVNGNALTTAAWARLAPSRTSPFLSPRSVNTIGASPMAYGSNPRPAVRHMCAYVERARASDGILLILDGFFTSSTTSQRRHADSFTNPRHRRRALTTLGDVRARERTLLQSRKHRNRRVAHVRRQITDGSRAGERAPAPRDAPQRLNDALNRRQFPRIIAKQLRRVRIQRNRGTTRVILAVRRRFTPPRPSNTPKTPTPFRARLIRHVRQRRAPHHQRRLTNVRRNIPQRSRESRIDEFPRRTAETNASRSLASVASLASRTSSSERSSTVSTDAHDIEDIEATLGMRPRRSSVMPLMTRVAREREERGRCRR